MRYPPSILEEIKVRLPISAVVGRRVALKKAGREWRGLSPFTAEKTPSFYVNDQKQFYHCFSSGKHGDIFSFMMETDGVSFTEAVERLAADAGVSLPKPSLEIERTEKRRASLSDVMVLSQQFFADQLKTPAGRAARDYLSGRGLSAGIIARFGLGYALPDRHALRDHLAAKGAPIELMTESGMLIHGEDITVPYDRFRDRIMFPIEDAKGRVIAFGGRAMQKDQQAKYLNSPETPLFHKGATLFNLSRARKSAHETSVIHVVEGYMDAIALDRAGIANVVAPLGTALTEDQLALLWRIAPEPILCFDGDKAGLRAAFRALDMAIQHLSAGKSLRFAFLPEGQDPDDLLRQSGPDALKAALERPRPLVDVLFEREVERSPVETPEQRAELEKRVFGLVAQIKDEHLRPHYRQAMQDRLQKRFPPASRVRNGEMRGRRAPGSKPGSSFQGFAFKEQPLAASERLKRNALFRAGSAIGAREAALVLCAAHHPGILEVEAELFAELILESPVARRLRSAVLDLAASGTGQAGTGHDGETGLTNFSELIEARGLAEMLALVRDAAGPAETWAMPNADFSHALVAWREAAHLHGRQSFLNNEIAALSRDLAEQGGDERFERLRVLVQRREALLETE